MSRQLSKILVSCALVVTILLAIVGTIFASYYSFGTVLNVEIYLNKTVSEQDTDSSVAPFAQVRYDGKEVNKNISVAHTSKVDLDVLSKGYNFVGWYKGTKADYEAKRNAGTLKDSDYLKAGDNNRLSFTASDYNNLVAVFDIIEYDVTWNYYTKGSDWKAEDTSTLSTTKPGSARDHYLYGQRISGDLNNAEETEYVWCGWQIAGDETKQDYKYATFIVPEKTPEETPELPEEGEEGPVDTGVSAVSVNTIELNAHWRDAQAVTVSYYNADGSQRLTAEDVKETEQNYTLKTPETLETILESLTLKDGYRYYWSTDTAGANAITAFETLEGDTSVYLQEKIITYTAKVENDALGFVRYNKNTTITFTVQDYNTKLTEVVTNSNWTKTYSYHMVSGVSYNDGTYNAASSIMEKIFETNKHSVPETEIVLAPIVSGYTKVSINTLHLLAYDEMDDGVPDGFTSPVYGGSGNKFVLNGGYTKDLVRKDEETITSLNIYELLGLKSADEEEVIKLYNGSDADTRELVTLRAIKITVAGQNESEAIVVNGYTSVCEFIETLINAGLVNAGTYPNTLEITDVMLMFCAESIQG